MKPLMETAAPRILVRSTGRVLYGIPHTTNLLAR
jgi:hypothetical protein